MQLVFAEPAEQDLAGIINYIALDNPVAAEKVFRGIVVTAWRLAEFPEMGHVGRVPGTREFMAKGLPYLVVYQATNETLTIMAVLHTARDLPRLLAARHAK